MEQIRIRIKDLTSIKVAYDCTKYYDRLNINSDAIRNATASYIREEFMKNNPEFANSAIEVRYDPIRHQFNVVEILPYIHVDESDRVSDNAKRMFAFQQLLAEEYNNNNNK